MLTDIQNKFIFKKFGKVKKLTQNVYHIKVTFGTPLASQTSLAVWCKSLAAFEVNGDRTMIGLSEK